MGAVLTRRLRHELDSLEHLISRNEVPCVIQGDSLEEEIHFVIHRKQARQLLRQKHLMNKSIYVKLGQGEMRCTLSDFKVLPVQK